MASSHNNSHSEAAKTEQVVTEFFAKSLHIILESRSPYMSSRNFSGEQIVSSPASSSSSSSSVRPRDKWFNLALRECPAALENLDLWHQSNLDPMVVDVILVRRPPEWNSMTFSPQKKERHQFGWNLDQEEFGCEAKSEKVIERWVLQYDSRKTRDYNSVSRRASHNTLHAIYRKSILLLRSLYATVRLLPAYKIFRDLNSSGQLGTFKLVPKVFSFVEPFTRKEEADMQRFEFTPVDTSCGRLCLSVLYRSSLSDTNSEPSTPMSPKFITDYVGSPLADPLKRLPSLPVSHGSPSSLPFSKRYSWSYDQYKVSPPSISFSPSPTHSESHALGSNLSSRRFVPPHPVETYIHKKRMSSDEYFPFPNYTPSSSPSPPIYIPGNKPSKGHLRAESAPVSIPVAKLVGSPLSSSKHPPLNLTRCNSSKPDGNSGPTHYSTTVEKLFTLGKDDTRRYSGLKLSSNSSLPISFSRSSSRSYQDDFEDSEFPCPFDVEDDITDPPSRPESFDQKGQSYEAGGLFPVRKSQDAAVGALVSMLKKAPPLRQDFSSSINLSEPANPEAFHNSIRKPSHIFGSARSQQQAASSSITSSGLFTSKTTADALEELRGYKDMKNLLLRQGSRTNFSATHVVAAAAVAASSSSEHSSSGTAAL